MAAPREVETEAAQGIGVGWLHKGHAGQNGKAKDSRENQPPAAENANDPATPPSKLQPEPESAAHHRSFRPHLHHQENAAAKKGSKDRSQPSPLPRRTSWISNLSSRFSSSASNSPAPQITSPTKELPSLPKESSELGTSPISIDSKASNGTQQNGPKQSPMPSPSPSPSAKSSGPSFITSALRRLSSSGGGLGKAASSGSVCPRRVMNVDPYRERCNVENIQPAKLRRVSFCVDVQIASAAPTEEDDASTGPEKLTLADPEETEVPPSMNQYFNDYKPGQIDKLPSKRKAKDTSLKAKEMSEGAALKNPDGLAQAKENSENKDSPKVDEGPGTPSLGDTNDMEQSAKKKEKKKRSEEERKERKEKRKQQAVANGTVPIEILLEGSSGSASGDSSPPQMQQNKPTTDPLRIYKRCCQLRETHALKRIADQLHSAPNGTVHSLDLTGLRFQLADVVTFGDFLAVVPVRRMSLQDCGLTDEALRVVLAGLLSVKTPQQADFNKNLSRHHGALQNREMEQFGVIEKLCLKGNSKIGREGWRHLSYFVHMSQSIKALDLTGVFFPLPLTHIRSNSQGHSSVRSPTASKSQPPADLSRIFGECLAKRVAGPRLEELVMADCELATEDVEKIVEAVIACGVKRLSVAKNKLTEKGAEAIVRYLESGDCEALDLSGNDLSELSEILTAPLSRTVATNPLYALSLEACNISTSTLKIWLLALTDLSNFRFLDLSHNRHLFAKQPNALGLLRRYLPQMRLLKRLNLNDVALEPDHVIAVAEILTEMPCFAHISILENPAISALKSANDVAAQEEACAMYASLMSAARVSRSIVSVEVDMPSKESGELVQAIAKQIVAYSLRNMETGPIAEVEGETDGSPKPTKRVEVPEILWHLVGHVEGNPENHDDDEPAPDQDYLVSGQAVVKALSVCLGNKVSSDLRRPSQDLIRPNGDTSATPELASKTAPIKAMSIDMLDSARKIRNRLQPALHKECIRNDEISLKRLQFLDSTLKRIVQQFENEYPECRPRSSTDSSSTNAKNGENGELLSPPLEGTLSRTTSRITPIEDDDDNVDDDEKRFNGRISRRASDISLASKNLANEEGRVHRLGQQWRREVIKPILKNMEEDPESREHCLEELRAKFEVMSGEELKAQLDYYESHDTAELVEKVMKTFREKR